MPPRRASSDQPSSLPNLLARSAPRPRAARRTTNNHPNHGTRPRGKMASSPMLRSAMGEPAWGAAEAIGSEEKHEGPRRHQAHQTHKNGHQTGCPSTINAEWGEDATELAVSS